MVHISIPDEHISKAGDISCLESKPLTSKMSGSQNIDYARYEGIEHSEAPAAIVFAALYIPSLFIIVFLSLKRPTFVWRSLIIFCLGESRFITRWLMISIHLCIVRATAFIIRSILAIHGTTSLDLVIAEQVIYGIGFFGLLYSAYTLALDR